MVDAFGGEDEASVYDFPLNEQVFTELFSDLAVLMDIDQLLG